MVKVEDILKDVDKQVKVQTSLDRFQPLRQYYKTKQLFKTRFGVYAITLPKFADKQMEALKFADKVLLKEKQLFQKKGK